MYSNELHIPEVYPEGGSLRVDAKAEAEVERVVGKASAEHAVASVAKVGDDSFIESIVQHVFPLCIRRMYQMIKSWQ